MKMPKMPFGTTPQSDVGSETPRLNRSVLNEFPDLRICLAHFGGTEDWDDYLKSEWRDGNAQLERMNWLSQIMTMVGSGEYPNLYTDISYTVFRFQRYVPVLKVFLENERIRSRTLFGSDYYMIKQEKFPERELSIRLRGELGREWFTMIAFENPTVYLAGQAPSMEAETRSARRSRVSRYPWRGNPAGTRLADDRKALTPSSCHQGPTFCSRTPSGRIRGGYLSTQGLFFLGWDLARAPRHSLPSAFHPRQSAANALVRAIASTTLRFNKRPQTPAWIPRAWTRTSQFRPISPNASYLLRYIMIFVPWISLASPRLASRCSISTGLGNRP